MTAVWINVTDGRVLVNRERLAAVYKGLPALEHILEGHPQMQRPPNPQTEGLECLSLNDEFGVSKSDFGLLTGFFSPFQILPESSKQWQRLCALGTMFGCSDEIDQAARKQRLDNPLSPNEDEEDKFDWISFPAGDFSEYTRQKILDEMANGFKLVSNMPMDMTFRKSGQRCFIHDRVYRKKRKTMG